MVLEKNLADLEGEIRFDHRLKENYNMKETDEAKEAAKTQRKWLSPLKNVAIFIYYMVVPFIQTPDWCTNAWRDYCHCRPPYNTPSCVPNKGYKFELSYQCDVVANGI